MQIDVSTTAGWFGNYWKITEYRVEKYEDGNSVTRIRTFYDPVILYDQFGQNDQNVLGKNIDVLA